MIETISADLKAAMKSGDKVRLETLRTLRAALMEKTIEKRGTGVEVSGDDELAVLITSAKKRKESIEQFEKAGRAELAEQERQELTVIQEYLPKEVSTEELAGIIRQVIAGSGATGSNDFGKVMPAVMKQVKGRADGKVVQEMVKQALGSL